MSDLSTHLSQGIKDLRKGNTKGIGNFVVLIDKNTDSMTVTHLPDGSVRVRHENYDEVAFGQDKESAYEKMADIINKNKND
jgi:hypothetical protein